MGGHYLYSKKVMRIKYQTVLPVNHSPNASMIPVTLAGSILVGSILPWQEVYWSTGQKMHPWKIISVSSPNCSSYGSCWLHVSRFVLKILSLAWQWECTSMIASQEKGGQLVTGNSEGIPTAHSWGQYTWAHKDPYMNSKLDAKPMETPCYPSPY